MCDDSKIPAMLKDCAHMVDEMLDKIRLFKRNRRVGEILQARKDLGLNQFRFVFRNLSFDILLRYVNTPKMTRRSSALINAFCLIL